MFLLVLDVGQVMEKINLIRKHELNVRFDGRNT